MQPDSMTPNQIQILRDTLIRVARDASILGELGFNDVAYAMFAAIEDIDITDIEITQNHPDVIFDRTHSPEDRQYFEQLAKDIL